MSEVKRGSFEHRRTSSAGGVILCGGRSSRMGRPKERLELDGRPFLEIIATTLAQAVWPIVLVAASDQALPPLPEALRPILVRDEKPGLGPLAALAIGLEALPADVESAYVCGCDSPWLTADWVRLVVDSLGPADIAMVEAEGRKHPLASAYRRSTAAAARRLIEQGRGRLTLLAEHHSTIVVDIEALRSIDPELSPLWNVNTPEELDETTRRWRERQARGM